MSIQYYFILIFKTKFNFSKARAIIISIMGEIIILVRMYLIRRIDPRIVKMHQLWFW